MYTDVIVVGGGPAGMMAAGRAAQRGARVVLVEKNEKLGRKLAITGKGRCNITNNCDIRDFIKKVPVNGSFLYSAFNAFTNIDLIDFFETNGLKTKAERGGRVFPEADNAFLVVDCLRDYMRVNKAVIKRGRVSELIIRDGRADGVRLEEGEEINAPRVLVATGGASYPQTGSTGDGYELARQAGHTITPLKPSLIPLVTSQKWVKDAQGLSLKNIGISLERDGKSIYKDFGEMILTHYGVSGPVILSASAHMRAGGAYRVHIDLKPALDIETLDKRIQRDFELFSRKHFMNALGELLPKSIIPIIIQLSGIPPHKPVHQISRGERRTLAGLLKGVPLDIAGTRPLAEAVITSGGVVVKEVNPSTMESKQLPGLFFAGEVLDVDAYTGGFNLQIAFSTGYLAGNSIYTP